MSVRAAGSWAAKERLRLAAIELFARRGFEGTGIRELSNAAGLSVASLYYFMGTKTGVLADVMQRSLVRMNTLAEAARAGCTEPEQSLAALTRVHVIAHALAQDETLVVDTELRSLDEEHRPEVIRLRDAYEGHWQAVIDAGCGSGVFTVARPTLARLSLIEMCSSVARWFSHDGPLSIEQVATGYVDMALALVRAGRGGVALRAADVTLPPFDRHHAMVRAAWALGEDG